MPTRIQLTHPRSHNPPRAPTWASVVRGEGTCAVENSRPLQQPAVTVADFSALYDKCSASGLKARMVFSHAAGRQMLSIMCTFPALAEIADVAGKRRRHHRRRRRRGRAATAAPGLPDRAATSTAATTAGPTPYQSPDSAPPPLKKLRKRRNEVELLRDCDDNSEIFISPTHTRFSTPSSPPISNLRAFASSTTNAVFRFTTDIRSTTARNARFADYPTCAAAP
jgi:hypothetical protein